MFTHPDIKELIETFQKHNVLFMLIGGYAVIHYTEPRFTKDIDFFVKPDKQNSARIRSALQEFGVPLEGISDKLFEEEGNFFKVGAPPWRVDLITSLKGVDFDSVMAKASTLDADGLKIPIISKDDLIRVKQLAGRPQDLIDLEALEAVDD